MTSSASRIEDGRLTLSDLQTVRFHESKGFGPGYDEAEVDAFMARCASELQRLTRRVDELEAQASSSAVKGPTDGYIATQSATILSAAQQTADSTVKNADEYSARVTAEARTMYDDARRKSTTMLEDAYRVATEAIDQANERHEEIERQTVYLRALRDSTKVQVETFLSGLLDHVTSEYGRALPAAVEAVQRVDASAAKLRPLERPERPAIEPRSG
jgi:DivIVA domain-containing protein